MNLILIIEFNEDNSNCQDGAAANCKNVLELNDINTDQWWVYMLLLGVLFVGFRIMSAVLLSQKAKRFY